MDYVPVLSTGRLCWFLRENRPLGETFVPEPHKLRTVHYKTIFVLYHLKEIIKWQRNRPRREVLPINASVSDLFRSTKPFGDKFGDAGCVNIVGLRLVGSVTAVGTVTTGGVSSVAAETGALFGCTAVVNCGLGPGTVMIGAGVARPGTASPIVRPYSTSCQDCSTFLTDVAATPPPQAQHASPGGIPSELASLLSDNDTVEPKK
jgi:hypothetical protein